MANDIEKSQKTDSEKSLEEKTNNLVTDIINEDDLDKAKDIIKVFNLNIAKKNAVRSAKLYNLLDTMTDQVAERINTRPDQISTKELLDCINTIQNQVDKSANSLNSVDNIPAIQINTQNNEYKINVPENNIANMSRESREKALDVITKILAKAKEQSEDNDGIIDVEVEDDKKGIQ